MVTHSHKGGRLLLVAGLLLGILVPAIVATPRTAEASHILSCSEWIPLTPKTKPGVQHGNYLEAGGTYDGNQDYTILNWRTRRLHKWAFWGNFNGRAQFGVSTFYATVTNRGWKNDPWTLCKSPRFSH